MNLSQIEFVPFEVRRHYPHMAPADVAIWTRFIQANPAIFAKVAYDVPVGGGAEFDTVVNPATGGDVRKLYQRKIDAVGFFSDTIFIVEVKPRASTGALGQVNGYKRLFIRDYSPALPVEAMIVTDALVPEMEFLAKEEGVRILLA